LLIILDWNYVEMNLVEKLADLFSNKRKEHVDALILKHIEELMQEYSDPVNLKMNRKLEESSEEMIQLFPNLEAEVLLNGKSSRVYDNL
jgi:hypothetical protein